ncbi:7208_t:CDS:2 [Funneliformis caledonium]|uniref:7208_t:CDS:1 n=1 Tax=Funneliformis caledonium TaxID=1117310 RepID=A0A9N9H6F2_9GLOM|nr:7208_t:CDS:2 [Funneliformis caledonium]
MNYYKNTPVEEWTRANIIDHYRGEKIITLQQRAKTLDTIKKDLQKVTADSEFDLTRRNKAQTILNNWSVAETLSLQRIAQLLVEDDSKGVVSAKFFNKSPLWTDILVSLYIIRAYEMINSVFNKNWSSAFKTNKRRLNGNEISNKIGIIRAKQQLRAIKNSAEQVDIFQKQFNEDTQKRSLENRDDHEVRGKKIKTSLPSIEIIKTWNSERLIEFLKEQNLFLCEKHFDILRSQGVTGYSFPTFTKEEFQECGLEIGPSKALATLINDIHNEATKSVAIEIKFDRKDSHDENFKALRKELSEKIRGSLREELSEELRESIRNLRESLCKDLCYKLNEVE